MVKGIRLSVLLLLALFLLICTPQANAKTHFSVYVGRPAYVDPYPVYPYSYYSHSYDYPSHYSYYSYPTYLSPAPTYVYPYYSVRVHRKHKGWKHEWRERERSYTYYRR